MKKRKFLKIARRIVFFTFIGSIAINFIGIWAIWKMKYMNVSERSIDNHTKKVLFHLYGIRNMTSDEKILTLQKSEDFMKYYGKMVDAGVANIVFPDQLPAYAVDSAYVINFHLRHGNPDIELGFAGQFRDHYNPMSEMLLSPFDSDGNPDEVSLYSYFTEIAHSDQFYDNPYGFEFRSMKGIMKTIGIVLMTGCSIEKAYDMQYHQTGSIEHEAHSIIGPKLMEGYLEYRCLYFKKEIDWVEKRLCTIREKLPKKKGVAEAKLKEEYKELANILRNLEEGPLMDI